MKRKEEWNQKTIVRREERKDKVIDGGKQNVSGKSAMKERGYGGGKRVNKEQDEKKRRVGLEEIVRREERKDKVIDG